VTTHAPLRSRWTKAQSVYHVQGLGDGDFPTSPLKDTRLLRVGSTAWFGSAGIERPTQTLGFLTMSLQAQRQTQPLIDFGHERRLSLAQHT
jgi:hypothetical protein